jgi:hypothetical protein
MILAIFFGELGQNSVASHHRQLAVEEPVAVVSGRTLFSVSDISASGKCVYQSRKLVSLASATRT